MIFDFFKRKNNSQSGAGFSLVTPKLKKYIEKTGGQSITTFNSSNKREELELYSSVGVSQVKILAKDCCEDCKNLDGKIFQVQDMIKQNILPNKDCTNHISGSVKCVCCLIPIFD